MPDETSGPPIETTTVASRTEAELAKVEAQRTELLARKAQEDAARDAAPAPVRALAIELHRRFCLGDHAIRECTWHTDSQADDVSAADWTEPHHARWLAIASGGVAVQLDLGWTVTPPEAPTPSG